MAVSAFTRKKLVRQPDALVESVCALCGLSVIASNHESLDRLENEHRSACQPRQGERRQAVLRTGERRIAILGEVEHSTRQGIDQRKNDRRTGNDRRVKARTSPLIPDAAQTKRPAEGR